jgi:salicylate hydroxylase
MPPRGESIGFALEDVVLLSRLLDKRTQNSPQEIFKEYDGLRRNRIEKAFDDANWGWGKNKDKGWFAGVMMEYGMSMILWWTKESRVKDLMYDVRDIKLD